jgi:MoaA/NifB/PqqE/SkfB family radical SAM enzyme
MSPHPDGWLNVDSTGCLDLPPDLVAHLGLQPGGRVAYLLQGSDLRLLRSTDLLARVYLEPTNLCNLDCATCMRNVWDEALGWMQPETFARVLEGLKGFSPVPLVFFGGYGEPLAHPHILEMVHAVRKLGAPVEIITNGILLNEDKARSLIEAGVETLWVSLDGATPESYADVRLGAELPRVLTNLQRLRQLRDQAGSDRPQLGIAFVAMRRNIADLPALLQLGFRLGVRRFSISNVLAHTAELRGEELYERSQYEPSQTGARPLIDFPRIDFSPELGAALLEAQRAGYQLSFDGNAPQARTNTCPFIAKGSLSIRWDGAVSPCLPLLHSHSSYLDYHERCTHTYSVGSLNEHSLPDLWLDPAYRTLRKRLLEFDFSPCVTCNTCEYSHANLEDCFGNNLPTCGGCLWAQGLIQCP